MANRILRDFISEEEREYRYKMGHLVASGLTGFIVGAVVSGVALYLVILINASFLIGSRLK